MQQLKAVQDLTLWFGFMGVSYLFFCAAIGLNFQRRKHWSSLFYVAGSTTLMILLWMVATSK